MKILEKIYEYYPKNLEFNSLEYQNSREYLNQLEKRKKALENSKYKYCLEKNLKMIFKDFIVSDWTDLTTYNCYEYRILLHKGQPILDDDIELITILNNERLDLFIFISILEKYYYIQFNKTKYKPRDDEWTFEVLRECPSYFRKKSRELKNKIFLAGYTELNEKDVREKVDYVETELKNIGEATIFNCLFTDIIEV